MKRYIYILFAMVSFLGLSCQKEEIDEPVYKDAGMLEVSFVYNQATAKSIALSPAFQTIVVEANLNIDGIKWNVVSDQPWCIVESDIIHEGSGMFTITVVANEGYDDREPAVVSLCAGEYKANLRVTQVGNVFVMDQVFGLGMKSAGAAEISVKVEEGTTWTTQQPDWMTVNVADISTANGETEYKMTVQWDENTSASRLGAVELYKEGDEVPSAKYALWQFGDGVEYDFEADGSIRLASKPSAEIPLEIRTPSNHIEKLTYPEWVQLEKVENDDNTTSWFLYFDPNASDSKSYRETQLTYTTIDSADEKCLSVIYQDSYPVGGLITAKGFALFAEKFNKGGADAVGDWVKDGVVNVLSPIDMSALETPWVSIGTEEHPFNLKFNGDSRIISGLNISSPLFGVCDGAEIYNITLDKSCAVVTEGDHNADVYVAALAEKITNTTISNCNSASSVTLSASAVQNSLKVYAGGLVAYAGASSTIIDSKNEGVLNASLTRTSSNGYAYVGGIAGYVACNIENCENAGAVADNTMSKFHYVGGLSGIAMAESKVVKCVNTGRISHTSIRNADGISESNRDLSMGGLIGESNGELEDLLNSGVVDINSNIKTAYLGGVVGIVQNGSVKKCYSTSSTVSYNAPAGVENKIANLGRYMYIGGVIGTVNIPLELDCSDMPVMCNLNTVPHDGNGSLHVGGLIGIAKKSLKLSSPKWDGAVTLSMSDGTISKNDISLGGVVGLVESEETVITGAETSGSIKIKPSSSCTWKVPTSVGGVVGSSKAGLSLVKCTNNANLEWDGTCAKSNDAGVVSSGGIIGRIDNGISTIAECKNNGIVANVHYHNNKWAAGSLLADRTGGIIGTYGYVKDGSTYNLDTAAMESGKITITDCESTADILAYRGLVGGIAGYLYNAEVRNCVNSGGSSNKRNNCNAGGIAGGVEKSIIDGCQVNASLYGRAQGSCEYKVGGIVAYLYTDSSVSNCKYYGHITAGDNGSYVAYAGGIVAETQEGCSVSGCAFGGTILNETITAENYSNYTVGNKAIEATNCKYWDGK